MKVMALVAGLLVGGAYIDDRYYHGQYSRGFLSMCQKVAVHFGLRV